MNRRRIEYITLKHEVKKTRYIFSTYTVKEILLLLGCIFISVFIIYNTLLTQWSIVIKLSLAIVIVAIDILLYALIMTYNPICHNGLGFYKAMLRFYLNKAAYVWGGIKYDR